MTTGHQPDPCDEVVAIEDEPRHHLIFANHLVRAFAVEIAPHDRTLCHRHPNDYVLYVAGDAEIVSTPQGEVPKVLKYQDGECEQLSAGLVHVVENRNPTPFRNLVVELLTGIDSQPRGTEPKVLAGDAKVALLLNEERAEIYRLEMQPKSEVELCGPAVLASPYDDQFEIGGPAIGRRKLSRFRDLLWIASGEMAALRSASRGYARATIVLVGRPSSLSSRP